MAYWIALALAIAGNIGANIAFTRFVRTTEFERSWASVGIALSQPTFWIGSFFGFMLLGCYLYSIRGIPLSVAYTAATSLSIVGITCAGVFLFGETVGPRAYLGMAAVLAGVFLITTA